MFIGERFDSKTAFMDATLPLYEGYKPAEDVIMHTQHVDLTMVIGPAGVGKDTVMRRTGLPRVLSVTTREPRENDGKMEQHGVEYLFCGDELNAVHEDIVKGRYVQWALGPNGNIYGSNNDAYPAEGPALIDVVAQAVPKMRELRKYLRSVESAYVVAGSFQDWIDRLDGRGQLDPKDRHSRLEEAYNSLHFGMDDQEMHFILNDDADEAALNLKLLAERHEDFAVEEYARKCGYVMLRDLSKELGLPLVYPIS